MLFILELSSKIGTDEESTAEEVSLKKEMLLSGFNKEDKEKIESFMYSCIQTMGIYSEEKKQERKLKKVL